MPIISSLGALTYSKSTTRVLAPWNYFSILIQSSNRTIDYAGPISLFDSTNNLYLMNKVYIPSVTSPNILKINISDKSASPVISWNDRNLQSNSITLSSDSAIYETGLLTNSPTGNLFVVAPLRNSLVPGQAQTTELHISFDKSNGNINTGSSHWGANANASGITGELRNRRPYDIVFDSTGNYTVIGSVNPRVVVSNVVYDNNQSYITKYDGSTGNIIFNKNFGVNANTISSGAINSFAISLDSGDNYRLAVNTYANSKYNSVIANVDSSFSTINWQKSIYNGSNVLSVYDSTTIGDNSYVLLQDIANTSDDRTTLCKMDSTGNIIWGIRSTANLSIAFDNIINDGSNLIFTGQTNFTVGNATLGQGHIFNVDSSNGFVNWQRQLRYTGTNYYDYGAGRVSVQGNLMCVNSSMTDLNPSNTANQQSFVSSLVLPSDGGIPSDGNYTLSGNINLSYTTSNVSFANVTLTSSTSNNVIMTPLASTFNNPITITKAVSNITPTFSQLT
jgi:hypothetical protein